MTDKAEKKRSLKNIGSGICEDKEKNRYIFFIRDVWVKCGNERCANGGSKEMPVLRRKKRIL